MGTSATKYDAPTLGNGSAHETRRYATVMESPAGLNASPDFTTRSSRTHRFHVPSRGQAESLGVAGRGMTAASGWLAAGSTLGASSPLQAATAASAVAAASHRTRSKNQAVRISQCTPTASAPPNPLRALRALRALHLRVISSRTARRGGTDHAERQRAQRTQGVVLSSVFVR